MSVIVKICGLTTPEAVEAVVDSGADGAGFVFADSPRRVKPEDARRLATALPDEIARVAVMRHPSRQLVDEVIEVFDPGFVQTDIEDFHDIALAGTCRPLPVLRAGSPLPEKMPRLIVFEGPVSGSGQVSDWEEAARLSAITRVVLAGGLTPDNVGDAICAVRPYGVDVSSGVESEPGLKDPRLVAKFVVAVREAEIRMNSLGERM